MLGGCAYKFLAFSRSFRAIDQRQKSKLYSSVNYNSFLCFIRSINESAMLKSEGIKTTSYIRLWFFYNWLAVTWLILLMKLHFGSVHRNYRFIGTPIYHFLKPYSCIPISLIKHAGVRESTKKQKSSSKTNSSVYECSPTSQVLNNPNELAKSRRRQFMIISWFLYYNEYNLRFI